ncbi:MAG: HD-GYP domain-containing protein [Gemmatimonadota bacterium]
MSDGAHPHRILIVDDEAASIRILERILRKAGYTEIEATTDSRRVLSLFKEFDPDIMLLDLHMPQLDGFAILKQIGARIPEGGYFPVLVITGDMNPEAKQQALSAGAKDFLVKPFDPVEVVLRVENLLDTRDLHNRLESRVRTRAEQLQVAEVDVAERLAFVAEFRDYFGGNHTQRVGRIAALIARALELPREEVDVIRRAAPLHDIGKIAIPDAILLKPGSLSLDEMDLMKTHTVLGAKMLAGSSSRILQVAEEIALYHHENWDGTGYTPGLEGDSIPLVGRIVAVADVWDALVHERPYKQKWQVDEALAWIEQQSGKKFDPDVVEAFLDIQSAEDLPRRDPEDDEWSDAARSFHAAATGD